MEKELQELFWVHFFGHPYRSNGTKIHLDAALNSTNVVTELTPNSTQYYQRNHPEQYLILSENSFERKPNYIRKFIPNSIKCY